jgi:lipoteichoic acid synthase
VPSANDNLGLLSSLGVLLSRRDWVYLLSLLVPLFIYNLALKASSISSIPGLSPTFDLMRSDVFFNLGYALFWIGVFAAVRGREHLRRAVVVLFHAATMLVVVVTTSAHQ